MATAKGKGQDKGNAASFINERRAVDDAINQRMKSENADNKLDPRSANNKTKTEYKPKDSTKKAGRTKH